ncbi:MAG: hypothetical protein ACMG5Z_05945 [Luteimonas sp.]
MPLTFKDRVKQAVSAGGSGALTLGAASSGFQAFAAGDDAKLFPYVIEDGTAWETGYGTYTHSGTSFARTSRTDSSTGSALTVSTSAFVYVDLVSNVAAWSNLAAQSMIPGGRLTLTTAVPVTTADVTAATTIYYTPYVHNVITLWDGNVWTPITFTEYTLALGTLTSGKPYDVFAYLSSGALALEMLAWTNSTTRATAVTLQDGRYCKSGDKTRLYLGSFYTTSTTTTEDSDAKRFLSNAPQSRVRRRVYKADATSHSYNGSARNWNNSTANRAEFFDGLGVTPITAAIYADMQSTGAGGGQTGLALNGATADAIVYKYLGQAGEVWAMNASSMHAYPPQLGYGYLQATELSVSVACTFNGYHIAGAIQA